MPDFARTNPERPRINSNRTSNKPERSTLIQQTKRKTNLHIILQNKRRYVMKKLQYDEMNRKKKDYLTLNKHDP